MNNGIIKRPTYGNNKHFTKGLCSIAEFNKIHYQLMLKKYTYCRMSLCLLGKNE